MRISVIKSDPGYHPAVGAFADVFLYGKQFNGAHTADEEKGEIWFYVNDAQGNYYVNGEELVSGCVKGDVKIKIDYDAKKFFEELTSKANLQSAVDQAVLNATIRKVRENLKKHTEILKEKMAGQGKIEKKKNKKVIFLKPHERKGEKE